MNIFSIGLICCQLCTNKSGKKIVLVYFQPHNNCSLLAPHIIERCPIKSTFSTTFLGIHLGTNIIWDERVTPLSQRLSSAMYALKSLRRLPCFASGDVARLVSSGLFKVKAAIWNHLRGGCQQEFFFKIFRLQKSPLRVIWPGRYKQGKLIVSDMRRF